MPAVFFKDYPPSNAAQMAQSSGHPYDYWSHFDQQYQQQGPASPAFSSAGASQGAMYRNPFSGYVPTASFSPSASSGPSHMAPISPHQFIASYASANSSMASPASLNTAALLAQHQRYYPHQYPQTAANSPRHFNFATSNEYELRSDVGSAVGSGSFHNPADSMPSPRSNRNSPRSSVHSQRSDADTDALDRSLGNQASYESSQTALCQDERDGLASLLSCSLISPRRGDERNDVLSEDEEDLFLFSDDEKDAAENQVHEEAEEENRSSPTVAQLANSLSCFSGEVQEEEPFDDGAKDRKRVEKRVQSMVSPVSLADHDAMSEDDDGTMDDTLDENGVDGNDETHPPVSFEKIERVSSSNSKNKKMVTIRSFHEQEGHATIEANPTFQSRQSSIGSSKKKSLLEQAKQRPVHSDIKPYKPEVHIPDDDSEASLIVLMRYMGCTPQAYGEQTQNIPADGALDFPSGKEFVFESEEEDDDVTTLSGGTYESSIKDINTCTWTVDGEGEEGIELLISDYLPPSMRLKRSVSLDEGTMMSGMFGNESIISKTASNLEDNESLGDPVTAAMKAVNKSIISGALTPRAAPVDKATTSQKIRSKPALTVKTRINDDSSCAVKSIVKEEEQVTKTASNVSRIAQHPAQPRMSAISPTATASSHTGTQTMSPASEAKAYLASRNEPAPSAKKSVEKVAAAGSMMSPGASGSKKEHFEQNYHPPIQSNVAQASIKSHNGDNNSPTSPTAGAKTFLTLTDDAKDVPRVESFLPQALIVSTGIEGGNLAHKASEAKASDSSHMDPSDVSHVMGTRNEQIKQGDAANSASSKRISDKRTSEVDSVTEANNTKPKDSKGDKELLISSITASVTSVQKTTESRLLSNNAPRVKIASADAVVLTRRKLDPPTAVVSSQKQLEPPGSFNEKKETATAGMTPLELKLANKTMLTPLKTDGSLTNMHIDGKNSALTPVSNISEGTIGTLDTMALISMAQRVSFDVKQRTEAAKKVSSYDLLKKYGSSNSALWQTNNNNHIPARATISTIKEMPSVMAAEEESSASDKKEQISIHKPDYSSQDLLSKYRPNITTANSNNLPNNGKVRRTGSNASGPSVLPPEESSSFDKNDVIKETKKTSKISTAFLHETSHEKMKEIKVSTSPEDNDREPPPPLTPCRESVREVDELLSKTRNWLARHYEDRKARNDLASIKEPSLSESKQSSTHLKERRILELNIVNPVSPTGGTSASPRSLVSPNSDVSSVSRKSILEELADLRAKQMKNSRNSVKVRLE